MKRWRLAFLALFCVPAGGQDTPGSDRVPVQILAINDFHGQISAGKKVRKSALKKH